MVEARPECVAGTDAFPAIGLLMTGGGGLLIGLGGSAYYVAAGIAILVATVFVWRRDRRHAGVATLGTPPLKIGDTLYLCNGVDTVFALDATTGAERWRFDPRSDLRKRVVATCRGVAYHRQPGAPAKAIGAERSVTATIDARLIALDARRGKSCPDFGRAGIVDLRQGTGFFPRGYYLNTSAPMIVRGRIVRGGWITDNQGIDEPSGVVRAFDAVSGRFARAWDIGRPHDQRAPAPRQSYTRGTPNVWPPPSADEVFGLVYLPTGNPTPDFRGGARTPVTDRHGSAVVAADARSGVQRWSFQTTCHDLWDYDLASPPTLIDRPVAGGARVPALVQPTKRGEAFVLDRRTGRPIVPVVERPVPGGAAPGGRVSSTQFVSAMPSFTGDPLTEAMMWGMTPIDQLWCRIRFGRARYDRPFTPPGIRSTIQYPGYSGGMSWGGVAIDPERGLMPVDVTGSRNMAG